MKSFAALAAVLWLSPLGLQAQNPSVGATAPKKPAATVHHQANFNSERVKADQLFLARKYLEALPLYEDLCRQEPSSALFAERHAGGLLAKVSTVADPKQKEAIFAEAMEEFQRAESLGDTDPHVEELLGAYARTPANLVAAEPAGGLPLTVAYTYEGSVQAQALVKHGESALVQNDLPSALEDYIAAAVADPKWYAAILGAGRVTSRMGDLKDAYVWFAKAIAIDPDANPAYRDWGSTLMRAGDTEGARTKYEQAVAAEPYNKTALIGLHEWASITHTSLVQPQVARPNFTAPEGKLIVDPMLSTETGDGNASWLVYEQHRVAHGARSATQVAMEGSTQSDGEFKFTPTGYVHTLGEEMDAIQAMLLDVRAKLTSGTVTEGKLEPGLKILLQLDKEKMLEPFILISFNDAGIRHGYPEYRAAHRDQIVAYIDRYLIGPPVPATPSDQHAPSRR